MWLTMPSVLKIVRQNEYLGGDIIKAGEAYNLKPKETRKSGFIDYVKGLFDKFKGQGR